MEKDKCPNCNSTDVIYKCHHNNRRKKIPIDVYYCKQCKKRYKVEGDKSRYNHKGNLYQRKPQLYEEDMHNAYPDMKSDETVGEYWKRKYDI